MPYRVEIISTNIIRVPGPEDEVSVVRVCYRWGDIVTRCIWIDEQEFSEKTLRELIKKDLEAYLKMKTGVLTIE